MDKARVETDKILNDVESQIRKVYAKDPSLLAVQKQYAKYMAMVQKSTKTLYDDFANETDKDAKAEKKKLYVDQVMSLTTESKEYNALVRKIVRVMATVNQKALNLSNDAMRDIYMLNYNSVADDCERVGIEVNG